MTSIHQRIEEALRDPRTSEVLQLAQKNLGIAVELWSDDIDTGVAWKDAKLSPPLVWAYALMRQAAIACLAADLTVDGFSELAATAFGSAADSIAESKRAGKLGANRQDEQEKDDAVEATPESHRPIFVVPQPLADVISSAGEDVVAMMDFMVSGTITHKDAVREVVERVAFAYLMSSGIGFDPNAVVGAVAGAFERMHAHRPPPTGRPSSMDAETQTHLDELLFTPVAKMAT